MLLFQNAATDAALTAASTDTISSDAAAPTLAPTQFIVRLAEGAMGTDVVEAALAEMRAALDIELTGQTQKFGFQFWTAAEGVEAEALAAYQDAWWYETAVEHVSYIREDVTIQAAELIPSDSRFDELWGLNNTGQTGGTADADIDAAEAWDTRTGQGVLVAVIDTGVDYTHSELDGNMWVNTGEIAGNGRDDDGNGYVDDVYGYDFAYNDGDPMDVQSHGTHVAGTIAAEADGNGVVGVAYNASIMALKFLDDSGSGATSNAIRAVEYAALMGAQVANNSWGGGGYDQALADAIQLAGNAGMVFVAAAGNDSTNNDASPHYPSNYSADNIISVAATDHNDQLSSFSNYGATTVDVAAPGTGILSSVPGGGYSSFNGTSMATPHVSGIVALMLEEDPTLTPAQIRERLIATSDPVAALAGYTVSNGRVNAEAALQPPQNGSIAGVVWDDADGDGLRDSGEAVLEGVRVYLDSNQNGARDAAERETWTDASGAYLFDEVAPGFYTVAQDAPAGYRQTSPTDQSVYEVADSDDAGGPAYSWVEISGVGDAWTMSDDSYLSETLPFVFEMYGGSFTSVYASSNGMIALESPNTDYANTPLGSNAYGALLAPFWDDLNPEDGGLVYTWADAANDRFIVQWDDIPLYGQTARVTFEAIISADGSVTYQYQDINGSVSATIGIQGDDTGEAEQVSYNTAYARDGLAVRISPAAGVAAPHQVTVTSGLALQDIDFGNSAGGRAMAEFGRIDSLTQAPKTITLSQDFDNPVVFLFVNSANGADPVTPRLLSVGANSFEVRLQEPSNLNDIHTGETVSWAVMEAGTWRLPDGRLLEVGTTRVDQLTSAGFEDVGLVAPFSDTPLLFSQVQTDNGADFVQTRMRAASTSGFELGMQEDEANNGGIHATETVGWFAIEEGTGDWGGLTVAAISQSVAPGGSNAGYSGLGAAPLLLGGLVTFAGADPVGLRATSVGGSSAALKMQEDTSADAETYHTAETANLLVISGAGTVEAAPVQPPVIAGRVWNDIDRDGSGDAAERGLDGWLVYDDANGNERWDAGEAHTLTGEDGSYRLYGLSAGAHTIRAETPIGWVQTSPSTSGGYTVSGDEGGAVSAEGFTEATYNWVELAGVGTQITTLGDDSAVTVSLPFAFDFYGTEQSSMLISSNGYLTFGSLGSTYTNTAIPAATGPNELIAPFWDDLNPSAGGSVYYWHDAANDRFIVQWDDVRLFNGSGNVTFQAILEGDGDIVFQYQSIAGSYSATVGIENGAGTDGLQISYNGTVSSGTAWRIDSTVGGPQGQEVTLGAEGGIYGVDFGTYSDSTVMAEYGVISGLTTAGTTITLAHRYVNPVVFLTPVSQNGADPVATRILDITSGSFTARLQEPYYLDDQHAAEEVSYFVVEAGLWQLSDGTLLEVGTIDTALLSGTGFESVAFDGAFDSRPAILSQVQTFNGSDFVQTRVRAGSVDGFEIAMEEEEARNTGVHATETVGYMAMEQGAGFWDGNAYEAFLTGANFGNNFARLDFASDFGAAPQLLAAMDGIVGADAAGLRRGAIDADGVSLRASEDRSLDTEIYHAPEAVSYLALEGAGTLTADPIASTGIDDPKLELEDALLF